MKLAEIQKTAKKIGIDSVKMKKDDLIRSIQKKEGNNPCFKSNMTSCGQMECCWREDCL